MIWESEQITKRRTFLIRFEDETFPKVWVATRKWSSCLPTPAPWHAPIPSLTRPTSSSFLSLSSSWCKPKLLPIQIIFFPRLLLLLLLPLFVSFAISSRLFFIYILFLMFGKKNNYQIWDNWDHFGWLSFTYHL